MSITALQIRQIAGKGARPELVAAVVQGWPEAVRVAKLTNRLRAAHFLSEIFTETGGLQILSESGAYRYETILKIFGAKQYSVQYGGRGHSAGIGPDEARRIAALPVEQRGPVLFNRVYGVGNPTKMREFGNTGPNDGWLYRGGGMMQCTGKNNYAARAKKTGLPLVEHPELLQTPGPAFKAAYLEWAQDGRCNAAADANNVEAVRKIINGGENGIAETRKFLAIGLAVLRDYQPDAAPQTFVAQETDVEPIELHPDDVSTDDAPINVQPEGQEEGDPLLWDVQQRLRARRYSPGMIDGKWGSGISGALSGFMNDRGHRLATVPTSVDEFHEIADEVTAELEEAETEVQPDGTIGWYRPVSVARANADPVVLKTLAPETVPSSRNYLAAKWGSITLAVSTAWDTVSGYVGDAYNFFTDHKSVIDDHPGIVSKALGYVAHVPVGVWLLAGASVLAFFWFNSAKANKISTTAVTNGERQ